MKTNHTYNGMLRAFILPVLLLAMIVLVTPAASAASLTFNAPANCSGTNDIKPGNGVQLAAYAWGAGGSAINGVTWTTATSQTSPGAAVGLSGFNANSATIYTAGAAPFNAMPATYSNLLRGAVYNSSAGTAGTVTLSNLTVNHRYFVQLWASDPRAAGANSVENVSSGGGPAVTLNYNSTHAAGGVGQFTYATFTADAATQAVTLDGTVANGQLQLNALQLRDITGVWSGQTSGSWTDPDASTLNFSGVNYNTVKAYATNVYFGDLDAFGNAVNASVTVGAGGVTAANVVFNNKAVNYTFASADASGLKGAGGVTLSGTSNVTFNGANTYTGPTLLNSGTLILGSAGALGGSTNIALNGGSLNTLAATLTLGSSQTLQGSGAVNGSLIAGSGSAIIPGGGAGSAGTLSFSNNLTLNGQAITFDMPLTPTNGAGDKIAIGGTLSLNGNSVITLNTSIYGFLANGTYTLITYASTNSGNTGSFTLSGSDPGISLNNNATSVTITVTGHSGTSLWVGSGAPGTNWTVAANWYPGLPGSGDNLIINDSTPSANLFLDDGPHTIGALRLGLTGTRTTAFTVFSITNANYATNPNWNTLTITNGLVVSNAASIALTIKTPVTVQGDQTWTVNSTAANAGTTTLFRGVQLTTPAYLTNTMTLNGTLYKAGLGMLDISQSVNIGNGNIVVQQGSLALVSNSPTFPPLTIGGTGSIIVSNGATLHLAVGDPGSFNVTKSVVLSNGANLNFGFNGSLSYGLATTPVQWNGTNYLNWNSSTSGNIVFSNAWTGSGLINWTNTQLTGAYCALGLAGDNSQFYGKMNCVCRSSSSTPSSLRFQSDNSGSTNAEWSINDPTSAFVIFAAFGNFPTNIQLGALSGTSGKINNATGNGHFASFTIGALNKSTTCGAYITDGGGSPASYLGLVKVGAGTLTLTSTNSYTGGTIINNGAVASLCATGSGIGNGPVDVKNGATFSGIGLSASSAVTVEAGGTLVTPGGTPLMLNSLTLGTNSTDLNDVTTTAINAGAGGQIDAGNSLIVNGTNIINITGTASGLALTTYDLIKYESSVGGINGTGFSGFKLGTLPSQVVATLQDSGTAIQLAVTSTNAPVTYSTNLTTSVSAGILTLSWPAATHTGWILQAQTNSLASGLGTNWFPVSGSTTTNKASIPLDQAQPAVFYRLASPYNP